MISKLLQVLGRWSLVVVFTGVLAACSGAVSLVSGLTEAEANEVLGLLLNAGIAGLMNVSTMPSAVVSRTIFAASRASPATSCRTAWR